MYLWTMGYAAFFWFQPLFPQAPTLSIVKVFVESSLTEFYI